MIAKTYKYLENCSQMVDLILHIDTHPCFILHFLSCDCSLEICKLYSKFEWHKLSKSITPNNVDVVLLISLYYLDYIIQPAIEAYTCL